MNACKIRKHGSFLLISHKSVSTKTMHIATIKEFLAEEKVVNLMQTCRSIIMVNEIAGMYCWCQKT